MSKRVSKAVRTIEADREAALRHWREVAAANEERLADAAAPARWRARAERDLEIARAAVRRIEAGGRVPSLFMGEAATELGLA